MVLDARTSDAIAIAMRTKAPIFTTREILAEKGFLMEVKEAEELPSDSEIAEAMSQPKLENLAMEELERELARHIEQEEYEEAAKVQAVINAKKAGNA